MCQNFKKTDKTYNRQTKKEDEEYMTYLWIATRMVYIVHAISLSTVSK